MELYVGRLRLRLLPSLPPHIFFLILTACCASLFPCTLCLDVQYQYCRDTSKCGTMSIRYPFGVGERGCGLPSLQINCVLSSTLVIEIKGQIYTILSFFENNDNIFLMARGENCQFLDDRFKNQIPSSEFADTAFKIMSTENRTLNVYNCTKQGQLHLSKCNATVYYALYDSGISTPGCSKAQVPVDAQLLQRVSNDRKRDENCRSCEVSGGICGYNTSDSTAPFLCYCKDTPRTDKCHGHGSPNKATNIIIGCSIGGAALTAAALVFLSMFYVKKRKAPPGSSSSKVEKFLKEYAYEMPTRYSQSQVKRITNNFVEMLGEGGYGVVYKGKLRNGTLVAVKVLDRQRHSEAQFMNEVASIGCVHHVNLVRLMGYCFECPTSALVYEYMVNGSLEKFIFAGKEEGRVLMWEQLYSIALGAARGIAYLHQDCEKRIIHFDIKPHNILLDAQFTPKVSDFGLAKLCRKGDDHISMTAVRGTPGYVAPEVCDSDLGPVTDKSDVYSFGMLLLEIVGGRKNINCKVSRSSQFYFPEWAFKMLKSEDLGMRLGGGGTETVKMVKSEEMGMRLGGGEGGVEAVKMLKSEELGMRLGGGEGEIETVKMLKSEELGMKLGGGGEEGEIEAEDEEKGRRQMIKVGLWCIQHCYKDRPCMNRVVQMLEGNGDDVGNPPFPFDSFSEPGKPSLSSTENTSFIEIDL